MRRALTMIEPLLALSLLSMLMLAIASWHQTSERASSSVPGPVQWRTAATAVLQLVHDDVISGDFKSKDKGKGGRQPDLSRFVISSESLEIVTRDRGEAKHRYQFDPVHKRLSLVRI